MSNQTKTEEDFRINAAYDLEAREFIEYWNQYQDSDWSIDFGEFIRRKKAQPDTDFLRN